MTVETTPTFTVEHRIQIAAPRERVFALLSDPAELARWLPMTRFEPRPGGHFEFVKGDWVAVGEVIELDPPRAIAWTWDWRDQPLGARTVVRFELEAVDSGTVLSLRHTGFVSEEQRQSHLAGWTHYCARLEIVAAGGDPGPDRMGQD